MNDTPKRSSFQIQKAVLFALILRETKSGFGQYRLGYLWALVQPIVHVVFLTVVFSFASTGSTSGVDFPLFVLLGIIPFFMFRGAVSNLLGAIDGNSSLFGYQLVKPMDAMIASFCVTVMTYIFILVTLLVGFWWVGYNVEIYNPLGVILSFGLLAFFCLGIGFLFCVFGTMYKDIKKLVPILIRPLYFFSAIFYSVDIVPQPYRDYLLWNPVVHLLSLLRENFFYTLQAPYASWKYPLIIAIVATFMAFVSYSFFKDKLLSGDS